ncbi:succinate dehydrogenase cytochrome b556 subunit C [Legionella maceachernii]|uniref:Succinate dehydrogenase cytochrome b556 subunit n=1 Tax=Legionella maceachernii TaxID=466 RepID=A0A0W0W799_9GAMM|nr:succinate dehydrogenase cytochrome b556 subunit C [Legionella maceachernii]SKA07607.1 succinate dehydrogenase subunit C [Legionella maceachernii]SUO99805.1 Succinate dehydrogenase cytochrome b556 subunit [Legionella maceachernii]
MTRIFQKYLAKLALSKKNRLVSLERHTIFFLRKILTVNQKRPVNLDLGTIRFPVMAIASILHRISGLILFLLMPFILYLLSKSLSSAISFMQMQVLLQSPFHKLLLWAFSAALVYHLLAGIRHMIMDLGYGEEVKAGRQTAIWVIALAVILTIFLGIWIW